MAALHFWEQQIDEPPQAYDGFVVYRELGRDRTLAKTAQQLGKSLGLTKRWSAQWRWVERAFAWDYRADGEARKQELTLEQERRKFAQRQLTAAQDFQRLAKAAFARLVRRDPDSGELTLARVLRPSEILALYEYGAQLEKLLLGQAPAGVEHDAEDLGALGHLDHEDFLLVRMATLDGCVPVRVPVESGEPDEARSNG